MFLRCNRRVKDGKSHDYWSVVENRRLSEGRIGAAPSAVPLGEINSSQPEAEHRMLLAQLRLTLPQQPPPKITAKQVRETTAEPATA